MDGEMKEMEKVLKALGNRRRLAILKILKSGKKNSVTSISEKIKLSLKATSKHLAVLYANNLIEREQVSLQMYYSLSPTLSKPAKLIIYLL